MSQVTNQLPYQELKPLPQAKEVCPRLVKLMKSVALIATVVLFTVGIGVALGLSSWNISVFTGSIWGGVIGLVAGIAMTWLSKFPTNVEQYRLETLQQVKGAIGNDRALRALRNVENFFYYPFSEFFQSFHHHVVHSELAVIGDAIPPDRRDARNVWTEFLNHLHSTTLFTPDKEKIIFNAVPLINRFSGKTKQVKKEWLSTWSSTYAQDLETIEQIGKESFGKDYAFSAEKIKTTMGKHRPSGLRVARNEETGDILGYGWYYTEDGIVHIAEIARRPEACRLNIGGDILYEILSSLRREQPVQISIRKSSPFIMRLQKWKFVPEKELPKHFPVAPPEDGILMKLDWKEYKKMVSQL